MFDQALRNRGLAIVTFSVESVSLDEKSEEYINNYVSDDAAFCPKCGEKI